MMRRCKYKHQSPKLDCSYRLLKSKQTEASPAHIAERQPCASPPHSNTRAIEWRPWSSWPYFFVFPFSHRLSYGQPAWRNWWDKEEIIHYHHRKQIIWKSLLASGEKTFQAIDRYNPPSPPNKTSETLSTTERFPLWSLFLSAQNVFSLLECGGVYGFSRAGRVQSFAGNIFSVFFFNLFVSVTPPL